MKVKDLIEKLKTIDPETLVVVGGFDEEGYADLARFEMVDIVPRKSQVEIFGEYRRPGSESKASIQRALWIDHD